MTHSAGFVGGLHFSSGGTSAVMIKAAPTSVDKLKEVAYVFGLVMTEACSQPETPAANTVFG